MTQTRWLKLDLLGYWHAGTGRGDGALADAVVFRDGNLPVVPGRTVKGLLRDAAAHAADVGVFDAHEVVRLFGSPLESKRKNADAVGALEAEARFRTEPGRLRVGTAALGASAADQRAWRTWAATPKGKALAATLVTTLSSTALEDGVAKDATLRTLEVAVPLTLYAPLELPEPEARVWKDLNVAVGLFLTELGSHRNRGLGRCQAAVVEGK
jgi:hypothetical protein